MADSEQARISWRKSTASAETGCAEVAFGNNVVHMRHSKDASGSVLTFTMEEWSAFLTGVRRGEFDASTGRL